MNGVCRRLSYQLITLEKNSPNKWEKISLAAEYLQASTARAIIFPAVQLSRKRHYAVCSHFSQVVFSHL